MISPHKLKIPSFIPIKIINCAGRTIILVKGGVGVPVIKTLRVEGFVEKPDRSSIICRPAFDFASLVQIQIIIKRVVDFSSSPEKHKIQRNLEVFVREFSAILQAVKDTVLDCLDEILGSFEKAGWTKPLHTMTIRTPIT